MRPETLPTGWYGTSIPGYRACPGTYATYYVEDLPAVPEVDGQYQWLSGLTSEPSPNAIGAGEGEKEAWRSLKQSLTVAVPADFDRFLEAGHCDQVPSCTACWVDLAAFRINHDEWLVLFLRDQQDCASWLLRLAPDGGQVVFCDWSTLEEWYDADEPRVSDWQGDSRNLTVCAQTFTEFIYRFTLENAAWFGLTAGRRSPLPTPVQEYVEQMARGLERTVGGHATPSSMAGAANRRSVLRKVVRRLCGRATRP